MNNKLKLFTGFTTFSIFSGFLCYTLQQNKNKCDLFVRRNSERSCVLYKTKNNLYKN